MTTQAEEIVLLRSIIAKITAVGSMRVFGSVEREGGAEVFPMFQFTSFDATIELTPDEHDAWLRCRGGEEAQVPESTSAAPVADHAGGAPTGHEGDGEAALSSPADAVPGRSGAVDERVQPAGGAPESDDGARPDRGQPCEPATAATDEP